MRFSFFSILALIVCASSTASPALAQSELEELPVATQNEIGRLCSPVQFHQGAAAYRNCVRSEINTRANQGDSPISNLSFDDKYAVQQACAEAGSESTSAFQNCVQNEIAGLNREPEPKISGLSEDEQYAVQQACFGAQSTLGAVAYRRCVNEQIGELNTLPSVSLASMSLLERNALQLKCSETTTSAPDYRRCLAIATDVALPPKGAVATAGVQTTNATSNSVQLSTVTATATATPTATPTATALPRTISPPGTEANDAVAGTAPDSPSSEESDSKTKALAPRTDELSTQPAIEVAGTAVETALNNTTSEESGPETTALAPGTKAVATQAANPTPDTDRTITLVTPQADSANADQTNTEQNTLVAVSNATTDEVESSNPVASGAMEKALNVWQQAIDGFNTWPITGKALLAAIIVVPLALLALLSGRRRRQDELYDAAYTSGEAPVRYDGPSLKSRVRAQLNDFDADDSQFELDGFADDSSALDELFEEHEGPAYMKNSGADLTQPTNVVEHHSDLQAAPPITEADGQVTRIAAKQDLENLHPKVHTDTSFKDWLHKEPEELRRQHCIEFLIYWIAYSDERYDPALKLRLFQSVELDAHDTIKRWVLKEDVYAFADTVVWIRQHCDLYERDGCVRLFMALLIPENALTPVQNTLLRFLSDAFGLGNSLGELYQEAYGSVMPPIPRVDKIAWWEKRSLAEVDLWDSRLVATWSESDQFKARLGLNADFTESEVVQAFRRASRRCHPENFQHLGEREQQLATRAYEKYENARDHLLGVEV